MYPSRRFVFAAHGTAGNNDVLFAVFRFIKKTCDKVPLRRYFFMAHGTYPLYTGLGMRITVRTAEDDATLVAHRHRPKYARIQIFFVQRKRAERTVCKRMHLLPHSCRIARRIFRKFNKIPQRKDNDNCRASDQKIIDHIESIARFE